jgi:SRSO17 transposase
VGGIALCQVAVTLTYATGRGHALIGRALYLPEGCAADEEHRELAGVPEQVMFATKPQLAGSLIERAHCLGSAPPSWQAMKCTAAVSCAAASASAGWAM